MGFVATWFGPVQRPTPGCHLTTRPPSSHATRRTEPPDGITHLPDSTDRPTESDICPTASLTGQTARASRRDTAVRRVSPGDRVKARQHRPDPGSTPLVPGLPVKLEPRATAAGGQWACRHRRGRPAESQFRSGPVGRCRGGHPVMLPYHKTQTD